MRKYMILVVMALMTVSCASLRAPARLNRLVNRVERNADRYRPSDWSRVNRKYENLVQEYIERYRTYTIAEKRTAMDAIGRYHALLVEHGIKEGVGIIGSLGAYVGGLLDILKQDAGAVEDFIRNVLGKDPSEASRLMKQLQDAVK